MRAREAPRRGARPQPHHDDRAGVGVDRSPTAVSDRHAARSFECEAERVATNIARRSAAARRRWVQRLPPGYTVPDLPVLPAVPAGYEFFDPAGEALAAREHPGAGRIARPARRPGYTVPDLPVGPAVPAGYEFFDPTGAALAAREHPGPSRPPARRPPALRNPRVAGPPALGLSQSGSEVERPAELRHDAVWSPRASNRRAAGSALRERVGVAFPEQGPGQEGLAEHHLAEQARLRELADRERSGDHLAADVQQEDQGWALLGMSPHGQELDRDHALQAVGRAIAEHALVYHDERMRAEAVLHYRDGRFVHADGDEPQSELTAANVRERMPLAFHAELRGRLALLLEAAGLHAEARQMRDLDPTSPEGKELYKRLAPMTGRTQEERRAIGADAGRYLASQNVMIYVMNRSGQFFAGTSYNAVIHHSSFLAGGAVAAAGDVVFDHGRIVRISNNSGHYKPGPAYLWQAVRQLQILGVDLGRVTVEVLGAGTLRADVFLDRFSPLTPEDEPGQLSFDPARAVAAIRSFLEARRGNKGGR